MKWLCCQFKRIQTLVEAVCSKEFLDNFDQKNQMALEFLNCTANIFYLYYSAFLVGIFSLEQMALEFYKKCLIVSKNYFRTIPWKGQAWSRFCKMISSLKATCHPGSPLPVWLWHPGSIPNTNKSSVDHCKKSTKKLLLQVEFVKLLLKKKSHKPISFPDFLRASWRLPNLHILLLSLHEVPRKPPRSQ